MRHAIAGGAIRDLVGLSSEHLRLGLTIAANQLKRGAKAEAMRIYAALVLCEPMNVDFQFGLANCALSLRANHLALQAASLVVALEPTKPRGYYLSGRACLALGHFSEAEEDMRKALKYAKETKSADFFQRADEILKKLSSLKPR